MDSGYAQNTYDGGDAHITSHITDPAPEDWSGRERRMNIRAYNYWESLLGDRPFPSVVDLDPIALESFSQYSLLIDFTQGFDAPVLRYIGSQLRQESGINGNTADAHSVPRGTVLSRLTDHYLEILANRAPVGFEAEFTHRNGNHILYRGILMPLSDDGAEINFIYGVVSWRNNDERAHVPGNNDPILDLHDIVEDETVAFEEEPANIKPKPSHAKHMPLENDFDEEQEGAFEEFNQIDTDAGLPDLLALSRNAAQRFNAADGRSRGALYEALGLAHAFAIAAATDPEEYQAILDDSGLKAQARAPYTPVVKLIFGVDHDKTRLTEYATVLAHASRQKIPADGFPSFARAYEGGLKAIVKAERAERRGEALPDRSEKAKKARQTLRDSPAVTHIEWRGETLPDEEFILLLGRRSDSVSGLDLLDVLQQKGQALDQLLTRVAERLKKS